MRTYFLTVLLLVGILPLFILLMVTLNTYEKNALDNKISQSQRQGDMLENLLYLAMSSGDINNAEINAEILRISEMQQGRILVVDNNLRIIKDTYDLEREKYLISEELILSFKGPRKSIYYKEQNLLKTINPVFDKETGEVLGAVVMNFPTKDILEISNAMRYKAIVFINSLSIVILIFSIYYSKRLTKPLNSVIDSMEKLTDGYLDEEISIKGYYEIEKISDAFNEMIVRLEKLESSRQEFVSNVSHELKTPITSIKVLADSLLMQEDVPAELYREFLLDITKEIDRENEIINDLLSLVKLDKKVGDMNITNINLNELLEQILKRLKPIAELTNVELIFESYRPVMAELDEVKITLAISNLIENAIKYNKENGWVRVTLNADHKYSYIKVSDSGIGIPEEDQENIFERFYRIDQARARDTGGTGLGLSITKNIINMHRGVIKLYSLEGEETTFNVRIPLNYIS